MKRALILAASALLTVSAFAIGASQEWVKDYISKLNGSTNSVIKVDGGDGFGSMSARLEMANVMTLVVTNSATSAVPNGTTFVFTEGGVYRSGAQTIRALEDAFSWNDRTSVVTNGFDTFVGAFSVYGKMVTPSRAKELMR